MAEQKKKDRLKNLMIDLGILMVLIGATAAKTDNLALLLMGLVLLALQTFDIKSASAKRIVTAEIILSCTLAIAAITQLALSKSFGTSQVFLVVLLLGSLLIITESFRIITDTD